ncbi:putative Zinc finger, Rad18-type [Corchorus capsularis]|uniref:Fanconi-associated nuclease n=1 Tax=Corchorus capsularis TaxID=210143 RepID=A0A1R3HL94_COCAP|nr:putative Zinc finger, Rad18-type [Corchorus capsularis]
MPPIPLNATKSGYQLCVRLTPLAQTLAMQELNLKSAMSDILAIKLQKLLMLSSHRRLLLSKLVHLAPDLGLSPNFRSRLCNDHPDKFKIVDTSYGRALELVNWDPKLAVPLKFPEVNRGLIVDRPLKFKQLRLRKGLNLKRRHRDFLMKFNELPDVCPYNTSVEDVAKPSIEAEKRACGVVREVLGMMVEKRMLIDHLTHFRKEFGLPNKLRAMIVRHPELFYVSLKGLRDSVFLVEGFDDKGRLLEKDENSDLEYDFDDDDNNGSTEIYPNGRNGQSNPKYSLEMLTGRESLSRLIGKRRRFLPNRQSTLSSPIQSSLNLLSDKNGSLAETDCSEGKVEMSSSDWVNCPVCGEKIPGGDYAINSHLDGCLSRRTKRKLTQRTLLQLNFGCSQSKAQISCSESKKLQSSDLNKGPCHTEDKTTCGFSKISPSEEKRQDQSRELPQTENVRQIDRADSIENSVSDGREKVMVDSPALSSDNEEPRHLLDATVDNISGVAIDTFIVGRRFSDEKDLNLGATLSLLRDPDNVKDSNAIKVVSASSTCCKVLGYLPRELAQYLSPLIEKYGLSFEGCVIAVPKNSLDAVPIQIVCQNMTLTGEKGCDNFEFFKHFWKKALQVVDFAKNRPPNTTKYQQNFCLLLQEVLTASPHLFTDNEKKFIESFYSLSEDSQRLFVRIYTRKGPWFRFSTIVYPEVGDSQQAVEELSATGYIYRVEDKTELNDEEMKNLLSLLTVSELRDILCTLKKKCNRGSRKQNLIDSLLSSYNGGSCSVLPHLILEKTEICIRITSEAESVFWRTERLFFLNGEQDLSAFLLVDLGIMKYPTYKCIISEQIFSSKSDLLAYEEAIEVAQIMDQSLDENNFELVLRCIMVAESHISSSPKKLVDSTTPELMATFLSCFSSSWVYSKVVLLGISFLEHEHRYNDAIHLLRQLLNCFTSDKRRGYWTVRLSIDLEHMGYPNESLSVAEAGLLDPWVRAGSRMALQRRVLRLGKPPRRWKTPAFPESIKRKIPEVHIQGRPLNCEAGRKSRFYGEDGEQCGVEQLALQYYAAEGGGWQGVHTESGIWLTIFGLIMWNILFSDVPNVFRTRFQTAPLDLETDHFYLARKSLIESHLQKVHDGLAEEILITSWELHLGTACRGVNWDRHSLSDLRAAVSCIGGPCLSSLCRHLAQDYRSWSSGMPDLLLWRFHGDYKGEAKLVEVKGPRDQLSEQQRAWLLLLMDCGFNAEVCKVSPALIST